MSSRSVTRDLTEGFKLIKRDLPLSSWSSFDSIAAALCFTASLDAVISKISCLIVFKTAATSFELDWLWAWFDDWIEATFSVADFWLISSFSFWERGVTLLPEDIFSPAPIKVLEAVEDFPCVPVLLSSFKRIFDSVKVLQKGC